MDDQRLTPSAALIVMAKRPSPGRTKTRLTPAFTPEAAAQLYECFLQDALTLVLSLPEIMPIIAYAPASAGPYFEALAPRFSLIPQQGSTLGERLNNVMTTCLEQGFACVGALNSDSPTLPAPFLTQAFALLAEPDTDVVLGPCDDGGYYFIGWKRSHPSLVRDVEMSTPHVLQDTLALARQASLSVQLLPTWYDVDTADDLARVRQDLQQDIHEGRHTAAFLQEWLPAT